MEYIKYYEEFKSNQSDLPPDLESQIKNSLKKNGKINAKNAVLKDEDNNAIYHIILNKGEIVKIREIGDMNESKIGDFLKKVGKKIINLVIGGAVILTLSGGLVSCEKYEEGINQFSYNVGGRRSHYDPSQGEDNKIYKVPTNTSIRTFDVDSTLGEREFACGTHGYVFIRPLTKTEAMVYRYGYKYDWEKKWVTSPYVNPERDLYVYDYDYTVAYYTYHEEGYDGGPDDPRTLTTWEDGLKYLKEIEGKNIDEIIRQCDQEVARGEWYLPTWEETSTHDKSIPRIPAEKLYDINIKK